MSKQTEALKLALYVLDEVRSETFRLLRNGQKLYAEEKVWNAITVIREALAEQPAQQQEPDRVKFERHWRKTRGEKKANRELPRHPLQPQTYIQDSANRHWVTWQAAVKSTSPPASKPLTDEEILSIARDHYNQHQRAEISFARAIEAAHGIKEDA